MLSHLFVGTFLTQFARDVAYQSHRCQHGSTTDTYTRDTQFEEVWCRWRTRSNHDVQWTGDLAHQHLNSGGIDDTGHEDAVGTRLEIGPGTTQGILQSCCLLSNLKEIGIGASIDDEGKIGMPGLLTRRSNTFNLLFQCIERIEY